MIEITSRTNGNTTKFNTRTTLPWSRIYINIHTSGRNTMNIMKTRYLSIDYLSFRKYPNEIFTLHLTTIPTICIITRLFDLMVIPKTTDYKVELSTEHNVEKIFKLLSNYTNTNKEKFTSKYVSAMKKSIITKEKQATYKKKKKNEQLEESENFLHK